MSWPAASSACNLHGAYCFCLCKQTLPGWPGGGHMDDDVLERFVRDYIASAIGEEVVFSWQRGDIRKQALGDMAFVPTPVRFVHAKSETRPGYCRERAYLRECFGGCPKSRLLRTPEGEPGLNYLLSGRKRFFAHAGPTAEKLAAQLGANQ